MMAGTELVEQSVSVFKQIRVGRITHLGITVGDIHFQRSAVLMTVITKMLVVFFLDLDL